MVNYKNFCKEVDRVFGMVEGLEHRPQCDPPAPVPDNLHYSTHHLLGSAEQSQVDTVIVRIRQKVLTEGEYFKWIGIWLIHLKKSSQYISIVFSMFPTVFR